MKEKTLFVFDAQNMKMLSFEVIETKKTIRRKGGDNFGLFFRSDSLILKDSTWYQFFADTPAGAIDIALGELRGQRRLLQMQIAELNTKIHEIEKLEIYDV